MEASRPGGANRVIGGEVIGKDEDKILRHASMHIREEKKRAMASWLRSPACPSHSGGMIPCLGDSRLARQACKMDSRLVPAIRFVPYSTVMGLSVLSRRVRQGTPSTMDSSWIPPESVSTAEHFICK